MVPIKDRIAQFVEYLKISNAELERTANISNGVTTKPNVGLSNKTIGLICKAYPQLNREWLETGVGEMLNPITNLQSNNGGNNQQNNGSGTSQQNLGNGTQNIYPCPEDATLIDSLRKEVERLTGELAKAKEDNKILRKDFEERISELKSHMSDKDERIKELKERVEELKAQKG